MQKLAKILFLTFLALVVGAIYLANTGQGKQFYVFLRWFPYGDKVAHFMLFGLLTLFTIMASNFKLIRFKRWSVFLGSGLVLIFVSLEELSQNFISSRTLDFYDYLANVLGILVFSCLSLLFRSKQRLVDEN